MRVSLLFGLGLVAQALGQSYWYENIAHQGLSPYNAQGANYQVFRNVKSFGAMGDGVTDDTAAINKAISFGSRCVPGVPGVGCNSSTTSPAVVYFPQGTYLISSSIISYYMTQIIGNPNAMPVLKATSGFSGTGLIDGDPYGSANQDYGSTNVFYRQVRNIAFDLRNIPANTLQRGIHWPTAQATSLQNCVFYMSQAKGNNHHGVFIENGSGGFMNDLVFYGGSIGLEIGSQQFTSRNLTFYNTTSAITMGFDWGWTFIGLSINNSTVGIDMTNTDAKKQLLVGSIILIDSSITNTPVGILTNRTSSSSPISGGSLALENVVLTNVPSAVKSPAGVVLAGTTGTTTIAAWAAGNAYTPSGPTATQGAISAFPRPTSLLSGSKYYARSKPQYQNLPASSFSSVRTAGAKGDGVTDDTTALQNIINSATSAGKIVFFDYGIYKITTVLNIPPGARIVGETYPIIMASGSYFTNISYPVPVVRIGSVAGQTGTVEWSDMIVSTQGDCAGATLIQWNLASPATTPSGMWDVHTRIGGFAGSDLQLAQCSITSSVKPQCIAAFLSMRITNIGSGVYMENVWLWTADHDIEDPQVTQISVYSGRGLSIESTTGNIWLIGTAVEHHALYQYQFSNTQNIFAGFMQTETPYYQPIPHAPAPFTPIASRNDPDFATFCAGKGDNCYDAWGLRVLNSKSVLVYGAGLYSFFSNYTLTCSHHVDGAYNEYCQSQIFGIDEGGSSSQSYSGSSVYAYGVNTVGAVSMIDRNGASVAAQSANTNDFAETVILFKTG